MPPGRSLLRVGGRWAIWPAEGINVDGRRSRLRARTRRLAVRNFLSLATICAAVLATGTLPGSAQYAAQLYPYCALGAASGATTC